MSKGECVCYNIVVNPSDEDIYFSIGGHPAFACPLDTNEKQSDYSFVAPVFGLWSPPKKNAPFVCIEPWYGRCDNINYEGEWKNREWGNKLEAGREFKGGYDIEIY